MLSKLPLVSHIEFMLQSLYLLFAHNPKKFMEFYKFKKKLQMKSFKLLRNVKTRWLSMLSPLKHVMVEYKSLIVKMHFDLNKRKSACDNLELLCDLLILGLCYANIGGGSFLQ